MIFKRHTYPELLDIARRLDKEERQFWALDVPYGHSCKNCIHCACIEVLNENNPDKSEQTPLFRLLVGSELRNLHSLD